MTLSTTLAPPALDELCINTLRFLAVDMVQQANSGHPGLPLGSVAMAYPLWDRSLTFNSRISSRAKPMLALRVRLWSARPLEVNLPRPPLG
jgi:hypothetical protein